MAERIWDPCLTDQDRAVLAAEPAFHRPPGSRPVLRMIDFDMEQKCAQVLAVDEVLAYMDRIGATGRSPG